MSSTETEEKKEEKIQRGLQVRIFDGEIDKTPEEKDKSKKTILKFQYPRVCYPWSRAGKDKDGKDVTGAVPSLAETLAAIQASGYTTEFEFKSGATNGDQPNNLGTVVGFLIDGWNRFENQLSRAKAENTKESAKLKATQIYAKMLGLSLEEAEKQLFDK